MKRSPETEITTENRTEESSGESRLAALRKRLFVLAGYVIVMAALLLYVSYGNYRIKMTATLEFPQVSQMRATISLTPNIEDTRTQSEALNYVTDLMPGDDAASFASDETDEAHRMTLTVNNYTTEDGTDVPSAMPMDYSLVIDGHGDLNLQFVLVDGDGNTCTSRSSGSYQDMEYRFYESDEEDAAEVTFHFDADTPQSHTYYIYIGWNNGTRTTKTALVDGAYRNVSTSSARTREDNHYRKEVEDLTIRAELTELDPGHAVYSEAPVVSPPPTPAPGAE